MAISDKTAPRGSLADNGWHISNPFHISDNPWKYQEYIQQSKAEFSIAKHGYVVGNTGWFSERSAGYLASGRPVVLQDTGFSDWLKTDFGLIPFNDANEALSAIEEINNNYVRHCQNARDLAEAYFSSDKVLTELIERSIQ
jgi:glycosyltransferase involved in cell wall biosynthesis